VSSARQQPATSPMPNFLGSILPSSLASRGPLRSPAAGPGGLDGREYAVDDAITAHAHKWNKTRTFQAGLLLIYQRSPPRRAPLSSKA